MIETSTGNNEFGICIGCRLPYGKKTESGNGRTNASLVIAGESGVEISDILVLAGREAHEQVPADSKGQAQVPGSGKTHGHVQGERQIIIGVRV